MDKCAKCGRKDDGWLAASVDINDLLCINCLDRFNEWCETHPGEPYDNFLQPKPWAIKPRGPAWTHADVAAELDMTDETAELSSQMAQLLWFAQNQKKN